MIVGARKHGGGLQTFGGSMALRRQGEIEEQLEEYF